MNFYEFLKFVAFSGISCIKINPENELLRQQCVRVTSVVNGAGPGQTWPVGSIRQCLRLVSVADMWAQSTATSAWSKLTRGPTDIS